MLIGPPGWQTMRQVRSMWATLRNAIAWLVSEPTILEMLYGVFGRCRRSEHHWTFPAEIPLQLLGWLLSGSAVVALSSPARSYLN